MTNQEKLELKEAVIAQIESESQSMTELPVVDTLDGLTSLPAMRGNTVVSAPLGLLRQPAITAAAQAESAATGAQSATAQALTAKTQAESAATGAQTAAAQANAAAQRVDEWLSDLGFFSTNGGTSMDAMRNANAEIDKLHVNQYGGNYTNYNGESKKVPIGFVKVSIEGSVVYIINNVINYSADHWQQVALNGVLQSGYIRPGTKMLRREHVNGAWSSWTAIAADPTTISQIQGQLAAITSALADVPRVKSSHVSGVDLDISDQNGNILARFANGHIATKNFDSSRIAVYEGTRLTYYGSKVRLQGDGQYELYVKNVGMKTYYDKFDNTETWNGGLAIIDDVAIMTFNKGYMVMMQWSNKSDIAYGRLASMSSTNHANNCSFGVDYYNGNSIPLLYVSECNESTASHNKHRCFVENVVAGQYMTISSTKIQTIKYSGTKCIAARSIDWAIDRVRRRLYAYGYLTDSQTHNSLKIMAFEIPNVSVASVTLTDADILEEYDIEVDGIVQGVSVSDGIFAIPTSRVIDSTNTPWQQDAFVTLYDLNNRMYLIKSYSISPAVEYNEVEGVCLYNGKLNMILHQSGVQNLVDANFYELTFN